MTMPAAQLITRRRSADYQEPIERELQAVEHALREQLASGVKTVDAVSAHLLNAGGKRLRPTLVLLSALACGGDPASDRLVRMAATTELIHMATLMHDDVIDDAGSRRGKTTVNSSWGNHISILSGDYVLARAFSLLAREGDLRILQTIAGSTSAMVEGEISQIEALGADAADMASYLSVIRDKTAAFTSACCRIGAIGVGATVEAQDNMGSYGLNFGMAFQITDDILDLDGDPVRTGKPIGSDIREGKVTMPTILALELAGPHDRARLESILNGDDVSSADIEFACELARQTGAIRASRLAASTYVDSALCDLTPLPLSPARTALEDLVRSVLGRDA
jgi:geranylgeranyl pyrophosphate synthase